MPLTKDYLRFVQQGCFNLIASHQSNLLYHPKHDGRICIASACENVFFWDLRKGEKLMTITGGKYEVSRLAVNNKHVAVGYMDGTVKLYDITSGDLAVTFSGHKSAVTALNFDEDGMRLVSGAKDTDVIVWDVVNECGMYRLQGHKGVITQAKFLSKYNVLITSSKDTLVKFWDLDVQHCFHTIVSHRSEVYDLVVCHEDSRLITGSGDMELRVFDLMPNDASDSERKPTLKLPQQSLTAGDSDEDDELTDAYGVLTCSYMGPVQRHGKDHVLSLSVDRDGRVLGCHGKDKLLELFEIVPLHDVRVKLARKQKKARRRAKESGEEVEQVKLTTADVFKRLPHVMMSAKLRGFDVICDQLSAKVVGLLNNNSLEQWSSPLTTTKPPSSISKLLLPAHRSDVRAVCFTHDNTAIASGSGESIKVWNRASSHCIRTLPSDYILGLVFAPGDRHLVAATKSGRLVMVDVSGGQELEAIEAHAGPVAALCIAPSMKSVITGSSDKTVKFWDFELAGGETAGKHLTLIHTRTLKVDDQVLGLAVGSNSRHLAVALLDFTVKVFFMDTLKFCLSLYGHKLPVQCLDICTDCSLLASGSADRNVKIWGMDFGDCHKSIFAHDDSVLGLKFVPKTHRFFTVGKDGAVKHWDGDKFDLIQILKGHHYQVWALAVSPSGRHVVTAGHDRSLRVWGETDEILVLDEEQETEREEKEQEEEAQQGISGTIVGERRGEVGLPAKRTSETVKAAEKIMEALEFYREEPSKDPKEPINPLFQAYRVSDALGYLKQTVRRVKSSELEPSLLVLPFSDVQTLLVALNEFLKHNYETELTCRCIFFLLRIHQGQITSSQLKVVDELRRNTKKAVQAIRDPIGFNMAGLNLLKKKLETSEEMTLFENATERFKTKKKTEKERAILTIKT